MGNWKLEAFKMGLYMCFPVGAFMAFNNPKLYENAIIEWRQELDRFTVEDEEFKNFVEECQRKNQEKRLKDMGTSFK